ncbi:MAG TPA: hypothetical protein O0X13_01640 [Methanocorpusculum sp.]|nr:hypothetical protein [Methanocorpusculum sp.]
MTPGKFSPVISELPWGYIPAGVVTTEITPDADGWYYAPGQVVAIAGDHQIKKAASGDHVLGHLTNGLHNHDISVLSTNDRVNVALFAGRRVDTVIASAALTAGTEVVIGYDGKASAYNPAVTGAVSDATATISLPAGPHGIVWRGGSANDEIEVIIY